MLQPEFAFNFHLSMKFKNREKQHILVSLGKVSQGEFVLGALVVGSTTVMLQLHKTRKKFTPSNKIQFVNSTKMLRYRNNFTFLSCDSNIRKTKLHFREKQKSNTCHCPVVFN